MADQEEETGESPRLTYLCKPLAYNLHEGYGRVCSRRGGRHVCGECIHDVHAPIIGFQRKEKE